MIKKFIHKKYQNHPQYQKLIHWLTNFTLPGFEKIPILEIIRRFREEIRNDAINVRASSISFFFILAMFPSIIFFFTLIPYIPIDNFNTTLMDFLKEILPPGIFDVLQSTIVDILNRQHGGLLSINFFMALIFATNGVTSIMQTFDKMNHTFRKRNFWEKRLVSLQITGIISFQLLLAVALIIISEEMLTSLLDYFKILSGFTIYLFQGIKFLLIAFSFFNTIASTYYLAPAVKEKYKYFSAGATFSTISAIILSYTFRAYIEYFHNFNQLYGSLGIIIVVMLWVYFNSINLLFGFELNNSIHVQKSAKRKDEILPDK